MVSSIQKLINMADQAKKLKEEKMYHANRMRKHRGDYDDAAKKFLECERKLAVLCKTLQKYNGNHVNIVK